jgi:hypothetical protein
MYGDGHVIDPSLGFCVNSSKVNVVVLTEVDGADGGCP